MTDKFNLPASGSYFLSHSVGCLPRSAEEDFVKNYFVPWRDDVGNVWPRWLDSIDGFRGALAALLGGKADSFCPQVNLSATLGKLLTSPDFGGAKAMLGSEDMFPSMAFASGKLLDLRLIPSGEDVSDASVWEKHLTDDIGVVLITHVHSNTGQCVPVADIIKICKQKNILTIVDVAQSAGIIPFDVSVWDADAVLGSCVKWLCGGPGAGFLWINPKITSRLEPTDVGWFSHKNPFEMDVHNFEYAEDARRFWGGTPSVAPYIVATSALTLIGSLGVSNIFDHNRKLLTLFKTRLPALYGDQINLDHMGGTACLALGNSFEAVTGRLKHSNVIFDNRGSDTIRLSFHIYNGDDEVEQLAANFAS